MHLLEAWPINKNTTLNIFEYLNIYYLDHSNILQIDNEKKMEKDISCKSIRELKSPQYEETQVYFRAKENDRDKRNI